ncbi:MAG: ABC transporter permease [Candidatus Hydrogenedentes bacterium]|nr:ABC transporter permease [Candidatus Hydrogenedentota bacterium]
MNALRPTLALAKRELRGAFSRWRLVAFLLVWITAAALLNLMLMPVATRDLSELANSSGDILQYETLALLLGLCLVVPSLAAVGITAEREQETLDQLRLTLLSDSTILIGKSLAAMAAALAFIVATLPIFAVAQFSVGLDNTQILELLLYLFTFTFLIVQLGIACSAFFRRALSSLTVSYLVLAVFVLLPLYLELSGTVPIFSRSSDSPIASEWITAITPISVLYTIINNGAIPAWQISTMCILPLLIGYLLNLIARWGIGRTANPKVVRQSKLIKDEGVLLARRKTFPYYLIDPLKPRLQIPDGKNAMFVREFRWGLFQRATWMVRGTYAVFGISLLIFSASVVNFSPDAQIIAFALLIGIFSLAIPAAFGNTFTKEREQGNFDMLRMTLLSAREVILGKTLGGSAVLLPALGAIFLAAFVAYVFLPESYALAACGFITMLVCLTEMVSLSLFASIISRRTSSAVTLGAALSVLAVFASYTIVWIIWNFILAFSFNAGLAPGRERIPWWMTSAISPFSSYKESFLPDGLILNRWNFYRLGGEGPDLEWLYGQFTGLSIAAVMLLVSGYILARYRMRDE